MILVTGGTGLVGSHLLFELVKKGERVKALKRETSDTGHVLKVFSYYSDNYKDLYSQIEWVDGDIKDRISLEKAFEDVTKVYHTAAIVSMDSSDNKEMRKVNFEGTANIVNLCLEKKVDKLCYVSSIAAVGILTPPAYVDENVLYKPGKKKISYASTKFNAEMEVWRGMAEGLDAVIVNPSIIFGPGVRGKGSYAMFDKIAKGLMFYTRGVNGYVDVRDVVKAMMLLMESDISGERFILNSENLSFREVFGMIAHAFNKPAPRFYANRFITAIVWRLDYLRTKLTGGDHLITKETAAIAHRKTFYSSEEIKKTLGIDFMPIEKSIERVVEKWEK